MKTTKNLKISVRCAKSCFERVWTRLTLPLKSSQQPHQRLLPRLSRPAPVTVRLRRASLTTGTFSGASPGSPWLPTTDRPQLSLTNFQSRRRYLGYPDIGRENTHLPMTEEALEAQEGTLHKPYQEILSKSTRNQLNFPATAFNLFKERTGVCKTKWNH